MADARERDPMVEFGCTGFEGVQRSVFGEKNRDRHHHKKVFVKENGVTMTNTHHNGKEVRSFYNKVTDL